MQIVGALITGILFGLGLSISEMINPARVIGFLDLAGRWDATLLFPRSAAPKPLRWTSGRYSRMRCWKATEWS